MSADFIARLVGMVVFAGLGVYWGIYVGNLTGENQALFAVIFALVGALVGVVLAVGVFLLKPLASTAFLVSRALKSFCVAVALPAF